MDDVERDLLESIQELAKARKYRIGIHAARHIIEEGFSEDDIVTALLGKARILEHYSETSRCLVMGYYSISSKVVVPLHIVCEYDDEDFFHIVTAYQPQKPWWTMPTTRSRKKGKTK